MILLSVGLVIALPILAVLVLPLGVEIASTGEQRRWSIIFAGLRLRLSPQRLERLRARTRTERPPQSPAEKTRTRTRVMRFLQSLSTDPGTSPNRLEFADIKEAWRSLKRVFGHVRFRVHQLDIVMASPDPALTGMAYGWACAAGALLPPALPLSLNVDFAQPRPQINYRVEISTIPILLLGEGVRYLWKHLRYQIGRWPQHS